jgi:hypothetical protein
MKLNTINKAEIVFERSLNEKNEDVLKARFNFLSNKIIIMTMMNNIHTEERE